MFGGEVNVPYFSHIKFNLITVLFKIKYLK